MKVMKKFLIMLFACITMTSCIVPAQVTTSDGVVTTTTTTSDYTYYDMYIYNGISYPVVYFNSIPYFLFENTWMIITDTYRPFIRHFDLGRHMHGPIFDRPHMGGFAPGRGWSIGPRGNMGGAPRIGNQPGMRGSSTRITGPSSTRGFQPRINNNVGTQQRGTFTPRGNMGGMQSRPSMNGGSRSIGGSHGNMGSHSMGGRR